MVEGWARVSHNEWKILIPIKEQKRASWVSWIDLADCSWPAGYGQEELWLSEILELWFLHYPSTSAEQFPPMVRIACMNKFHRASVWCWGPVEHLITNSYLFEQSHVYKVCWKVSCLFKLHKVFTIRKNLINCICFSFAVLCIYPGVC